ncbi:nitrate ABC transporter substrate-binding protein [Skermanella stibiiresistens SB22]|uniref:Thiamine pyrimidine synthase n=1 Tax=Skermanella stibiiresistens SB22 TaxID=1385369 RepID=W9GVL4_9PROT|nr:ABC transporter substrate-binding protein [Skermanella stibiiresistens]EWY36661.1 nitrate ABC transporter substrate-binding protein [Skermanella stibiiresistens SB22]
MVAPGGLTRRDWLKAAAGTACLSVAGSPAAALARDQRGPALRKIGFQVGWLAGGNQIGEVCAKRMGFYEREEIDVNIIPGGANVDGLSVVASDRCEIGQLSSSPALMIAISQNVPVKCFAVGTQRHPFAFFSLKDNPVRAAQDIVGKRVGVPPTSLILVRSFLAANGIDFKDVSLVPIATDMGPMLRREIDVMTGWMTNMMIIRALGDRRVELRLWDAGVRLYAQPYYATLRTIREQPDLLARFVIATSRGWEYAFNNHAQAADLLIAEYPQLRLEDERPSAKILLSYALNEATRIGGWGVMDPAVWADQIELFARLGQFPLKVPRVEDVMTMEILDATKDQRPHIG